MTTDALHHHEDPAAKVIFGFWVYIMTDCIMFASLFATYIVLQHNTYGSIDITQTASLSFVLAQTLIFLLSGLTYGLAMTGVNKNNATSARLWVLLTFVLGFVFVSLGFHQLHNLVCAGYSWQTSGFLSAYFTLIGVQGIHVCVGLVWMLILLVQLAKQGLSSTMHTRFSCLGLFWDFLNIVWLMVFVIVYLMGAI